MNSDRTNPTSNSQSDGACPLVSVVVCTYSRDRMGQLRETLESLEAQSYPSWETLVVVDYNPALRAELETMIQGSTRLAENTGTRGLSGARNTGIERAQGEIVAFIDDDARADPRWIEGLVECYRDLQVLASGGRIVPVWEGGQAPAWLPEEFLWVMGCSYRGLPNGGPVRNVIGCNMSFRSLVFDSVGGFNPVVGRLGTKPLGCEETEICIRALKQWPGHQIMYVPDAVVYHNVPNARQTFRYFMSRCYSEGISKAVVRRLAGPAGVSSERSYATRTLIPAVLRNLKDAILLRGPARSLSQAAVICLGSSAVGIGFAVGALRSRNQPS